MPTLPLFTGVSPSGAMLAEEIVLACLRADAALAPFEVACGLASVLARLGALHASEVYRAEAITAPGADYATRSEQLLAALADRVSSLGIGAACYGLAASDLQSLLP